MNLLIFWIFCFIYSDRYGNSSQDVDGSGSFQACSFHERMMKASEKPRRSPSRSPNRGSGWGGDNNSRARSRSRSAERFDQALEAPPVSQEPIGCSFHETMMARAGTSSVVQKQMSSTWNSENVIQSEKNLNDDLKGCESCPPRQQNDEQYADGSCLNSREEGNISKEDSTFQDASENPSPTHP